MSSPPRKCRNSRAYAVSVLALASGLGAGVAVVSLPLADLADNAWRLLYVIALIWLVPAVGALRRLPETARFRRRHVIAPRLDRRRFAILGGVAFLANIFVAPASFFQNRYLEDVRGYSALVIATFTLVTATPAAVGLMVGGRVADAAGRRRLIAVALPLGTVLVAASFAVGGVAMWLAMTAGAVVGSIAFPAMAVYRTRAVPHRQPQLGGGAADRAGARSAGSVACSRQVACATPAGRTAASWACSRSPSSACWRSWPPHCPRRRTARSKS
ncbi:MAG: MFS transporter [Ilumatobacteraceae bacterium]